MYFIGSATEDLLSARDEAQNEKNRTQETTVRTERVSRMSIRRAGESLCIYLWFRVKSTTVRGDLPFRNAMLRPPIETTRVTGQVGQPSTYPVARFVGGGYAGRLLF